MSYRLTMPREQTRRRQREESREELMYGCLRLLRPLTIGAHSAIEKASLPGFPVAQRAVLDLLRSSKPLTVPGIARALLLDRQPVQRVVDLLRRAGLLQRVTNPAHAGSPLIELTGKGRETIDRVVRAESLRLAPMIAPFSRKELATCRAVFEHLRVEFAFAETLLKRRT